MQRAALARLEQAGRWRDLAKRVSALEAELDGIAASAPANAELVDVLSQARQLRVLHHDVSTVVEELELIVRQLEHDSNALDADARKWQERLSYLENRRVPAPVLERAQSIAAKLQGASARVREYRDDVLLGLDRGLALLARIDDARALAAVQEEQVRARRAQLEQSSLWQLARGTLSDRVWSRRSCVRHGGCWEITSRGIARNSPYCSSARWRSAVGSSPVEPGRAPGRRSAATADRSSHRC